MHTHIYVLYIYILIYVFFVAESLHSSWPSLDLPPPSMQIQRAATSQRSLRLSVSSVNYLFISLQ